MRCRIKFWMKCLFYKSKICDNFSIDTTCKFEVWIKELRICSNCSMNNYQVTDSLIWSLECLIGFVSRCGGMIFLIWFAGFTIICKFKKLQCLRVDWLSPNHKNLRFTCNIRTNKQTHMIIVIQFHIHLIQSLPSHINRS